MVDPKPISELGEFGWLRRLLPRLYWPSQLSSQLCIGPGDDAGALRLTPGKVLVVTTDAMVEGVHFERSWFPWEALGHKVMAVNLSDLAAMGNVKPLAALVTASVPGDTPVDSVDKFYRGMESCAQQWKTGFLGGDTVGSRGGWSVSVTLFGEADPKQLIKRSGARVNDLIVSIGPLGLPAAALEVCQEFGMRRPAWTRPLIDAFFYPQPLFQVGALLGRNHWATSLLDCSDGLEASVRLLAESSHVGAEIDLSLLPLHPALVRWAKKTKRSAQDYALKGGEEYGLVFTVTPSKWKKVRSALKAARVVGRILPASEGCRAVLGSQRRSLNDYGYSHFSKD